MDNSYWSATENSGKLRTLQKVSFREVTERYTSTHRQLLLKVTYSYEKSRVDFIERRKYILRKPSWQQLPDQNLRKITVYFGKVLKVTDSYWKFETIPSKVTSCPCPASQATKCWTGHRSWDVFMDISWCSTFCNSCQITICTMFGQNSFLFRKHAEQNWQLLEVWKSSIKRYKLSVCISTDKLKRSTGHRIELLIVMVLIVIFVKFATPQELESQLEKLVLNMILIWLKILPMKIWWNAEFFQIFEVKVSI